MRICVDQPIEASVAEAQAAFLDPSFYRELGALEGISAPELRTLETNGRRARVVVGYKFAGRLNGPAAVILDPAKLTWAQVSDVDLDRRSTQVTMLADNYAGLLSFSGWYELVANGEAACYQHFEADLRVNIPLLGPLAERAIAGSIRQNLAETATLMGRYVAARRGSSA